MDTARRIAESRLTALEREMKFIREKVEWLCDQVRDVRITSQMAAEDAYNLGEATQAARAAFRHFQAQERAFSRAFHRRAGRRR